MCGIAGVIGHPEAAELTGRMTAALAHRGPDSDGYFEDATPENKVVLGHRRLAILDLTARGTQPMTSRDGRWTIVLNGEIFNYREMAAELPDAAWRSGTDTEVLLETIAHVGLEQALDHTIGMFALACWDHRERTLLLARDRIGEKPLVYFWDGHTFAFASELKALAPLHRGQLDLQAVDLYFALGYIPAPASIFRHTRKLPAGHILRFTSAEPEIHRWWFPERVIAPAGRAPAQQEEELRALVFDAVRLRLRADVPIALALSGGIDSTVIAAELARHDAAPDAFTVVFDNDHTDLAHAREAARAYNLRHEVLEGRACLDDALEQYDEPFADSSSVATLALARALAGRYKVVLNGDGGDEAFGGYRHYEFIAAKQALKAAAAAVGLRDGAASHTVYVQSKTTFREAERARLLNGHACTGSLGALLTADPFLAARPHGPLKRALWSDRHLYLANDLTYKMDMALAAYGLEGRAPLLDHRILEWSQNLEDRDLVDGREKKVLFRRAYRAHLPPAIFTRKKHGFGAPIDAWLAGPLREQVRESLPCPLLDRAMQAGLTGQRLWTAFVFARWARRWRASW